jgi:hypothetical protein
MQDNIFIKTIQQLYGERKHKIFASNVVFIALQILSKTFWIKDKGKYQNSIDSTITVC